MCALLESLAIEHEICSVSTHWNIGKKIGLFNS